MLHEPGTGKGPGHEFLVELMDSHDLMLYDLTTVLSWSEQVKRVEKGYNEDNLYRNQFGVVQVVLDREQPADGRGHILGWMRDFTTFKEFLDVFDLEEVGFTPDRRLFSEELTEVFETEDIGCIARLRKNSRLIDLRWVRWHAPFGYRGRAFEWPRCHEDPGQVYVFEDSKLWSEHPNTLKRRLSAGEISREAYGKEAEQDGIVAPSATCTAPPRRSTTAPRVATSSS